MKKTTLLRLYGICLLGLWMLLSPAQGQVLQVLDTSGTAAAGAGLYRSFPLPPDRHPDTLRTGPRGYLSLNPLRITAGDRYTLTLPGNPPRRAYVSGQTLITGRQDTLQAQFQAMPTDSGLRWRAFVLRQPVGEIVIAATRRPEGRYELATQLAVIDPKEARLFNPPTSAHLLETSGQVFMQRSQLGGGSPHLRGFAANSVLLVVDGLRMNTAIFRSGNLQNVLGIDPFILENTEVMFGSGSLIYGSDALGGVMAFNTRDAPAGQPGDSLEVEANLLQRYATAANEWTSHADVALSKGRFGSLTSVTYSNFGDLNAGSNNPDDFPDFGKQPFIADRVNGQDVLRPTDDPFQQTPSGYEQVDVLQKFRYHGKRWDHQLNLQYSETGDVPRYDRLILPKRKGSDSLKFAEWFYGPQVRALAGYRLRHRPAANPLFDELTIYPAYQRYEESRHDRKFGEPVRRNRLEDVDVWSLNAYAQKRWGSAHTLDYGVAFNRNDVRSRANQRWLTTDSVALAPTRYPAGGSQMTTYAGYVRHRWEPGRRWNFTGGLRYTNVQTAVDFGRSREVYPFLPFSFESDADNLSGSLGVVYQATGRLQLTHEFTAGFRAPNIDDLSKIFDSTPGNVIVANPDLQPEQTFNFTPGLRWLGERLEVEAYGYATFQQDAIVRRDFQVEGRDSIFFDGALSNVQANVNAGRARILGFSFQAKAQPFERLPGLRVRQTLNRSWGRELSQGVPLDHIPPLFGRTELHYRHGKGPLRFRYRLYARYQSWKDAEDFSPGGSGDLQLFTPEGVPSWWTLNLRTELRWRQFRFLLGVENLFDRHYRTFGSGISGPGRNFSLGLKVKL